MTLGGNAPGGKRQSSLLSFFAKPPSSLVNQCTSPSSGHGVGTGNLTSAQHSSPNQAQHNNYTLTSPLGKINLNTEERSYDSPSKKGRHDARLAGGLCAAAIPSSLDAEADSIHEDDDDQLVFRSSRTKSSYVVESADDMDGAFPDELAEELSASTFTQELLTRKEGFNGNRAVSISDFNFDDNAQVHGFAPKGLKLESMDDEIDSDDGVGKISRQDDPERFPWLVDVRDAEGRRPQDPQYDPRTLFIPQSQWAKFTPFERQFWEIKCKLFDTVVFFKKGKFYELYETDADIGANEFNLKMVDRVNMRMAGVPEATFDAWAGRFVAAGHKVARVDQVETAIGKVLRERDAAAESGNARSSKDKLVGRELSCVFTSGTISEPGMLTSDGANHCMSIKCDMKGSSQIGIAVVDSATGRFFLSDIVDDGAHTLLETCLRQLQPKELLLEKGHVSSTVLQVLRKLQPLYQWRVTELDPISEFWDSFTTWHELSQFFSTTNLQSIMTELEAFKDMMAMCALGGLISYLRSLKLDANLLGVGWFEAYDPMQSSTHLVLDGQVLADLDILPSSSCHRRDSLLGHLDFCLTAGGRRQLEIWLRHPLRTVSDISARQHAIDVIMENEHGVRDFISKALGGIPDLERILSRIHAGSARISDVIQVLDSVGVLIVMVDDILASGIDNLSGGYIGKILCEFPVDSARTLLADLRTAFDRSKALSDGVSLPTFGADADFDLADANFAKINQELQNYLLEQQRQLRIAISFKDMGKEVFQMEVSSNANVPPDWTLMSKTKSVKRYWTPAIRKMVTAWQECEERRMAAIRSFHRRLLMRIDKDSRLIWRPVAAAASKLDALFSLARFSMLMSEPKCMPNVTLSNGGGPSSLVVTDLRYPCLDAMLESSFIPNDLRLGETDSRMILLTGPNMGGKSTLLRQTCLAVILAQMGCYVPAGTCELQNPIDRIFTRLGASDNIIGGQSTFMVELMDAAKILRQATCNSLIAVDELGRGTSTFDGAAIARAVLSKLAVTIQPIGLFATHYRSLADDYDQSDQTSDSIVRCMHMSCAVDELSRRVTFLYKLVDGVAPQSYGMHVAQMAGVPSEVIDEAQEICARFGTTHHVKDESTMSADAKVVRRSLVRKLCQCEW